MSKSAYSLRWAKKIKAINVLGGKCKICGNDNIFVLVFHHKNKSNKEQTISKMLEKPWLEIKKETKKCILLCCNCHQELHYPEGSEIKKKLLNIKGENRCFICGYKGKSNSSLSLHHEGLNNKNYDIGQMCNYTENRFNYSRPAVLRELEKCIVICENCHRVKHLDKVKFEKFKIDIYDKINKLDIFIKKTTKNKPYNKLDEKEMKRLCMQGKKFVEIAKIMSCSISAVKRYLKGTAASRYKEKLKKEIILKRKYEILLLWKRGMTNRDIAKKAGYGEEKIISAVLKGFDVVREYKNKKQKELMKKQKDIVEIYRKGLSMDKISRIVGISDTQVGRILRKNNVIIRKQSDYFSKNLV